MKSQKEKTSNQYYDNTLTIPRNKIKGSKVIVRSAINFKMVKTAKNNITLSFDVPRNDFHHVEVFDSKSGKRLKAKTFYAGGEKKMFFAKLGLNSLKNLKIHSKVPLNILRKNGKKNYFLLAAKMPENPKLYSAEIKILQNGKLKHKFKEGLDLMIENMIEMFSKDKTLKEVISITEELKNFINENSQEDYEKIKTEFTERKKDDEKKKFFIPFSFLRHCMILIQKEMCIKRLGVMINSLKYFEDNFKDFKMSEPQNYQTEGNENGNNEGEVTEEGDNQGGEENAEGEDNQGEDDENGNEAPAEEGGEVEEENNVEEGGEVEEENNVEEGGAEEEGENIAEEGGAEEEGENIAEEGDADEGGEGEEEAEETVEAVAEEEAEAAPEEEAEAEAAPEEAEAALEEEEPAEDNQDDAAVEADEAPAGDESIMFINY